MAATELSLDDIIKQRKLQKANGRDEGGGLDDIIRRKQQKANGRDEKGGGGGGALDDIIRRKQQKANGREEKGGGGGGAGRGRPLMKMRVEPPLMKLRLNPPAGGQVIMDARNKIIQKKRSRIRDARDRLAEIAKQGDARDKINKKRKINNTQANKKGSLNGRMKPAGFNTSNKASAPIVRKTTRHMDENINENLTTYLGGQTRMQGSSLIRIFGHDGLGKSNVIVKGKPPTNFSRGVQRQINTNGRPQFAPKAPRDTDRYHPLPNNPHVVTIKNDKADLYNPSYHQVRQPMHREAPMRLARNPPVRNPGVMMGMGMGMGGGMRSDAMMRARSPEHRIYRSRKSPEMEEIRPTRLKITTSNNYREPSPHYNDGWDSPPRMAARAPAPRPPAPRPPPPRAPITRAPARKRSMYDDEEMEVVSRPKKMAPLSSELMARLDQQPQRTAAPRGCKVLVTNLHHCVSVEDMEELFGTIGPIVSARIMREGIAEAMFQNEDDAYRSVEVFNNRQLDGQPMSVTVVNKKAAAMPGPPPIPAAAARSQTKSILKAASGSTLLVSNRGSTQLPGLQASRKLEKVAPDPSTIRQALFKHSQALAAPDHTFLVKLPKSRAK